MKGDLKMASVKDNFVAMDIGASSSRVVSDSGIISIIPNNMVYVDNTRKIELEPHIKGKDIMEDVMASLDVSICKTGGSPCNHFPVRVLVGELAERYSENNVRPSVMQNKTTQRINYISAIMAIAIEKMVRKLSDDIYVYVALPPLEVKNKRDEMKNQLLGSYEVTFNKISGGKKINFNILDVEANEESYMALMSFYFDMAGKVREEAKNYMTGNILSLDIGASTTDLAVVKNMVYQEKSGQTYKTGGNVVRGYVANYIRDEFEYDPTQEVTEEAIATGRLQAGGTYVVISDKVEEAKRRFAESIVAQVQEYFRMVNIPLQTVRAIVVSGGGSLSSKYEDENGQEVITTGPISDYVTEKLQDICPGIEVVSYGDDSRLANVKGLFVRAYVAKIKRQRAAQEVESQK